MRGFTGIDLPDGIKRSLSAIQGRMPEEGLSYVSEDAMHITLHFFESIGDIQKQKVIDAIDSVNHGRFDAGVHGLSHFGGSEVRVLFAKIDDPSGGISALYENIGSIISKQGIKFDRREKFTPHVTIARCRKSSSMLKMFIEENSERDFGSITVSRIFFKSSVLTGKGSLYTTLSDHEI